MSNSCANHGGLEDLPPFNGDQLDCLLPYLLFMKQQYLLKLVVNTMIEISKYFTA